jgi:DNA-binding transcriptional LysR family regulator
MWEAVEMRHLRAFLAVADELHFGRAADRLRVSQSRISQLVRELETIVGASLFARNSRRVSLTPAGERLLEDVVPAYGALHHAVDRVSADRGGIAGPLPLGLLLPSSGGPRLPDIIGRFERSHPGATVVIHDIDWNDPLAQLRRAEVDLLAIRFPIRQPDLTVGPVLATDGRALAVSRDHPLAGRDRVTLEEIADYTVAQGMTTPAEMIEAFLPRTTPSGRPIARTPVSSATELMTRVARGEIVHMTIVTLAEYIAYPGVVVVPIPELPPSSAGLVWRTNGETAAVRAFAEAAREVLSER